MKYLLTFLTFATLQANAALWQSEPTQSDLNYRVKFERLPIKGQFSRFKVALSMIDKVPQKLFVEVDINSVNMGNDDIDQAIKESDWFHIARFPKATFISKDFILPSDSEFIARGELSLKGVTQPLNIPMTIQTINTATESLTPSNEKSLTSSLTHALKLEGKVEVNRLDFLIGMGDWAIGDAIGTTISVQFTVVLMPSNTDRVR
jgi:polyisoprenoid-binding protein YceI